MNKTLPPSVLERREAAAAQAASREPATRQQPPPASSPPAQPTARPQPSSGTKRKTSSKTILLKPTEQDPDYVLVHRAKTATLREYREPLPQSPRPLEPAVNPDNDAEVLYNDDSFDNPYAVLRHQFKDDNVDDDIDIVFRDPVT
ncbi:hypothetical protein P43SY_002923 [Pythium insidiosum]|uniref:Uncharacterized protein n=1 Tax=Pythium insidiosum TaxID=114742 RepID=A0AAD5LTA5_PYTIN|nr:hypothetical protein P43SY_002923 [Pythium insidiosum]